MTDFLGLRDFLIFFIGIFGFSSAGGQTLPIILAKRPNTVLGLLEGDERRGCDSCVLVLIIE